VISIPRLLFGNLPPTGRGVYARDQAIEWLMQFDFVLLPFKRSDTPDKARALLAAGKRVYYYGLVSEWTPEDDEVSQIGRIEALCDSIGGDGGLANPENGWQPRNRGGSPLATPERAMQFAQAIADSISRGYKWGINHYPEMRFRDQFAASGAWMSPSFFHPQDSSWYDRYVALVGKHMIIPSVPLWTPVAAPPAYDWNAATFGAFLAGLPPCAGAIGFKAQGTSDAWMTSAYLAWDPWQTAGGLMTVTLDRWVHQPAAWLAVAVLVLILIMVMS
jgi:hypothetical protein